MTEYIVTLHFVGVGPAFERKVCAPNIPAAIAQTERCARDYGFWAEITKRFVKEVQQCSAS